MVRVHQGPPGQSPRESQPTHRPLDDHRTGALTLAGAIDAFLLSRTVSGCTARTCELYRTVLARFARAVADSLEACSPLAVQGYLSRLREAVRPPTAHLHFSKLRAFFRWCVESDVLSESPVRGLTMKTPKTLPRVPEDDHVRRLLLACDEEVFEGRRNRALVALLADSGLRIGEALRLRIEDLNFAARTVNVRAGKGQKDGVGFFGAEAAQHLRAWLGKRRNAHPEDYLFCDRGGRSLTRNHALHILHRLSDRAGLTRRIGPHALRHYAATSILRQTGDLELVRQVLRHESLAMALRYAHLTKPDVSAKFRRASPLDNLRAGR
ncbi:MAG: tyrosine-type recombinase/integrase [Armatimonadota bacterium]